MTGVDRMQQQLFNPSAQGQLWNVSLKKPSAKPPRIAPAALPEHLANKATISPLDLALPAPVPELEGQRKLF